MSNMKSVPLVNGEPVRRPPARIGLVSGRSIERAFVAMLYMLALALALLSWLGTFYGLRGMAAPLAAPWQMAIDAWTLPGELALALLVQLALTLAQWGARQLARRDPRWWLLYLAALGLSVYYNLVAYYDPAVALGVPWLVALLLIVGGDAAPEFTVVRD